MTMPLPVHRDPAPAPAAGSPAQVRHGLAARLSAEAFGSLFLVVAGLGVPLFSIPQSSPLPAALAAGLAVTAAMLAVGYVSGGHFNPAVTVGHAVAGRIRLADAAAYIGAQLVGGLLGALALFGILRTLPGIQDSRTAFDTVTAGFGEHSIIQAPLAAVLLLEVLGAAILVAVFIGTTKDKNNNNTSAAVAVGLAFAVLLQLGLSVGNAPFNPARATASAVFSSSWSLEQLWVFWVAPLVGAAIAGLVFRGFAEPAAASGLPAGDAGSNAGETAHDAGDAGSPEVRETAVPATAPAGSAVVTPEEPENRDEAREFFDGKRG
ncbi:MIP/aquaporin family protein [Pseudarthrobacter sp. DSP2-3-2b1]|uniref:MIP/aquaporin family protein n=1 Tax=Pseudarthrobacter sp. DSP2-3-2b1 TaxID=2804661 RepID=UPI003CED0FE5